MPEQQTFTSVEAAYSQVSRQATVFVARIEELLIELPDPDNSGDPPDWGHVAALCEVNKRLTAVVAFLEGTEV